MLAACSFGHVSFSGTDRLLCASQVASETDTRNFDKFDEVHDEQHATQHEAEVPRGLIARSAFRSRADSCFASG